MTFKEIEKLDDDESAIKVESIELNLSDASSEYSDTSNESVQTVMENSANKVTLEAHVATHSGNCYL